VSEINGEIYIAELMDSGYQITTYKSFFDRYAENGAIRMEPNTGANSNAQVALRAISEQKQSTLRYDLVVNNCESYINRAMHGKSISSQVVNTALGLAVLAGVYYVLKNLRHAQ
jgi:hypothetical protein